MQDWYWLNEDSVAFLNKGYLLPGVTPIARIEQIARRAEEYLGIPGYADKFIANMAKGWYSLSSPEWSNYALDRGLAVSCFGGYAADDTEEILFSHAEQGMLSKLGGGTSMYFGHVRHRGAEIKDNGTSNGVVPFVGMFERMTDVISQGCYDDKTEILTEKGWMLFDDVTPESGTKVAQVNDDDTISFVTPTEYFKYRVDEDLLLFQDSKNINLLVTKNHNMVFKYDKKIISKDNDGNKTYRRVVNPAYRTSIAKSCPLHRDVKFAHASFLKGGVGLAPLERLYIALQADGSIMANCTDAVRFRFKKQRKVDRLEDILQDYGVEYSYSYYDIDDTHNFYINLGHKAPKLFKDWVDLDNISKEWAEDFLKEVSHWDASGTEASFSYSSTIKSNVDIVQAIASMSGFKSYSKLDMRENEPNKQPIYKIYLSKGQYFGVEKVKPKEVHYNGFVYCVEVPSHKLIVRREGHTLVCGNSTRRGYMAAYLDANHPDIEEFLRIGEDGSDIQAIMTGVCLSDEWLASMEAGDKDKRRIWAEILRQRSEKGYPYLFFSDNVNKAKPLCYANDTIYASNLCSEIALPASTTDTFTCVLASMNLLHYDEWKDTDAVEVLTMFLDTVVQEMIDKIKAGNKAKFLGRVLHFAENHRALGLGVLGWHSYLQSKMIPFESRDAAKLNYEIFKNIRNKAEAASIELGAKLGTVYGTNRRNTTVMAIAPTKSSSFILGQVSQGIEPLMSNYYIKDTAKAVTVYKNPHLVKLLQERGLDNSETWKSIQEADGSVQHLESLTDEEKMVFRTFAEINPQTIIDQAAIRQEFIDQAQSINLMIPPTMTPREINQLYLSAWKLGVKSLYYQFSLSAAQVKSRELTGSTGECVACHA